MSVPSQTRVFIHYDATENDKPRPTDTARGETVYERKLTHWKRGHNRKCFAYSGWYTVQSLLSWNGTRFIISMNTDKQMAFKIFQKHGERAEK